MPDVANFTEGDPCPIHGTDHKKTYTFGSSMSAETSVCVFKGCRCAVSVAHDPIGVLPATVRLHESYSDATGVGRIRAMDWAAKLRD